MGRPVYLSLLPLPANTWDLDVTIGGSLETLTVDEGRYFNDAFVAGDSLAQAVANALNTHSGVGGNPFAVAYDLAAGEYTISRTGAFDIDFPVTAARDWLGFSGNVSGASSYTSDQVAQGTIFAGSDRARFTGRQAYYQVNQTRSQAGPVAIIGTGVETFGARWEHALELVTGVPDPLESGSRDDDSSVVPWVWHDFFRHHLQFYVGEPFRFYADVNDSINDYEDEYQVVDTNAFDPAWGEEEVAFYCIVRLIVADYVVST